MGKHYRNTERLRTIFQVRVRSPKTHRLATVTLLHNPAMS